MAAVERGWLDAAGLWEVAQRSQQLGATADASELFEGLLTPDQLLSLGVVGDADASWTIVDPGSGEAPLPPISLATTSRVDAELDARLRPVKGDAPTLADGRDPSLESRAPASGSRYVIGDQLGVGGSGRVVTALDREIGRTVALKTLRGGVAARRDETHRFLREARITGQLEHPNIIALHELGMLGDGQPYYTMPLIKQRSLRDVVSVPPPRESWPLARLCGVLVQVCRALAYAHFRGVIHRDLKPENILVGDYGEVYVADWGVARLADDAPVQPMPPVEDPTLLMATGVDTLVGTAGYMAPEQIQGHHAEVDHRADLFAIGAILYEVLTGERAFPGSTSIERVVATVQTEPVRPRATFAACPLVLEDLCLALLAKDKRNRPDSADVVAVEIEAFLEGVKERTRRREEADALVASAAEPVQRYRALDGERLRLEAEAHALLSEVDPWAPVEDKRPGWAVEDRARDADTDRARALAEAIECYARALGHDPEHPAARIGLADLYWSSAERAAAERNEATRIYYETLASDYDDGRYRAILQAPARLSVDTDRPGVDVSACRWVEIDRVFRPGEPQALGPTPIRRACLTPGSYLLILRCPGHRDVRYPVVLGRGEHHEAQVRLYTDAEIGDGFVYVPAGPTIVGGDDEAQAPLPRQRIEVGDFAISRFPVTYGEYLAFVNDLARRDPDQARRRLPQHTATDELCAVRNAEGMWIPAWSELIEGTHGREYCPEHRANDLPIESVDWFDARAYGAWLSRRDGVAHRLPTEAEWEKAARGVDGRFFPWGDRFDPTFTKMRESRPGFGQPEPVGAFATDESVYGARDLAGSMRCWTADIHGELSAADALGQPDPEAAGPDRDAAGMRVVRGGAWFGTMRSCRAASRLRFFAISRSSSVGVRLVRPLGHR